MGVGVGAHQGHCAAESKRKGPCHPGWDVGPQRVPTPEKFGTSGPQGIAASKLTYLPSKCWLVTFRKPVEFSGMSGTVNALAVAAMAEVGVNTVLGACHTEQITFHSPAIPPAALHVAQSWGGCGLPWPAEPGAGPREGAYSWATHLFGCRRPGHRSKGSSHRPGKAQGAQDCLRTMAAGVQLNFKHSRCLWQGLRQYLPHLTYPARTRAEWGRAR